MSKSFCKVKVFVHVERDAGDSLSEDTEAGAVTKERESEVCDLLRH